MIVLPAVAAGVAFACAAVVGRDAWRRPRPERMIWALAFLLFAVGAGAEVAGGLVGWTPSLARVYYLTGAVLVVGLLALGELYLLAPGRMPAVTPGLAVLVVSLAVTAVWSAPINADLLEFRGWAAIERGPFLVALAALINSVGTLVLVGGAAFSAWRLRGSPALRQRAVGCGLIAVGAIVVAIGGTLTRLGQREYLYVAMVIGISMIFAGVMFTRRLAVAPAPASSAGADPAGVVHRARLTSLPMRADGASGLSRDAGIRFIAGRLLSHSDGEIADACLRWSASVTTGTALSRDQARQVWALRLLLPDESQSRFDDLPLATQAQIAELYLSVWSTTGQEVIRARQA